MAWHGRSSPIWRYAVVGVNDDGPEPKFKGIEYKDSCFVTEYSSRSSVPRREVDLQKIGKTMREWCREAGVTGVLYYFSSTNSFYQRLEGPPRATCDTLMKFLENVLVDRRHYEVRIQRAMAGWRAFGDMVVAQLVDSRESNPDMLFQKTLQPLATNTATNCSIVDPRAEASLSGLLGFMDAATERRRDTLLHIAARHGRRGCCRLLLRARADPATTNLAGETPSVFLNAALSGAVADLAVERAAIKTGLHRDNVDHSWLAGLLIQYCGCGKTGLEANGDSEPRCGITVFAALMANRVRSFTDHHAKVLRKLRILYEFSDTSQDLYNSMNCKYK